MKRLVYRVEHKKTQIGPYQNSKADPLRTKMEANHETDGHPAWPIDGIHDKIINNGQKTTNYLSGFYTLPQLYSWFGVYLQPLLKRDYIIKAYIVENRDIIEGYSKRQIAFRKSQNHENI